MLITVLVGESADGTGGAGPVEVGGHPHAGGGQPGEVDAGLDTEPVQHPDQVLGGEVAGGGLGVRAAAEPAGRRVDRGHAVFQRRVGVGEGLSVGVVEVHADLVGRHALLVEQIEEFLHMAGVATPMVSPRLSSSQPMSRRAVQTRATWCSGTAPSQGSPKHMET